MRLGIDIDIVHREEFRSRAKKKRSKLSEQWSRKPIHIPFKDVQRGVIRPRNQQSIGHVLIHACTLSMGQQLFKSILCLLPGLLNTMYKNIYLSKISEQWSRKRYIYPAQRLAT